MKHYFLALMRGAWCDQHINSDEHGDVCMGNHADVHRFINALNPMMTEHFDAVLEGLWKKESAFIELGEFKFCLTRVV